MEKNHNQYYLNKEGFHWEKNQKNNTNSVWWEEEKNIYRSLGKRIREITEKSVESLSHESCFNK